MSPLRSFKVKKYFKTEDKDEIREMMIASANYSYAIALADDVLDYKNVKLSSSASPTGPRKRAKLDNLTPDEKIRRKKLKNREAAQTSRDKKRLYLCNLEAAVKLLKQENEKLQSQVTALTSRNVELVEKNLTLEKKLQQATTVRSGGDEPRPAAPIVDPQQKDNLQLTPSRRRAALLSLPLLLLSATFPTTWTWTTWTGLTRSMSPISKNWKGSPSHYPRRLSSLTTKRPGRKRRAWWGPAQRSWNPLGSMEWTLPANLLSLSPMSTVSSLTTPSTLTTVI